MSSPRTRPLHALSSLLITTALAAFATPSGAQGTPVIPNPRAVTDRIGKGIHFLDPKINLLSEEKARQFWQSERVRLLPSSTVALGSNRAALFTELASVISGGWRFAAGTTLAVATDEEADDTEGDTEDEETASGFQKFVAGGGNLSLGVARPMAVRSGNYNGQIMLVSPRVWANIPSLSDAEAVEDYGGELALEYQYLRYENRITDAEGRGTGVEDPEEPFLTFHVRSGVVMGSSDFYRTVGRGAGKSFAYVAPTLNFVIQGKLKLGATYFYSPSDDFRDHQSVRINLSVLAAESGHD